MSDMHRYRLSVVISKWKLKPQEIISTHTLEFIKLKFWVRI